MTKPKFEAWSIDDYLCNFKPHTLKHLVEGIMLEKSFTLIHGIGKIGKTRFAMELAASIASGTDFLNRFKTDKRSVLYMDLEFGPHFFSNRIEKIASKISAHNGRFMVSHERLHFSDTGDFYFLEEFIKRNQIEVLVIDSFYRTHNKEENASKEILPVLIEFKELTAKGNCSVILIHHQGKRYEGSQGNAQSYRGSSSILDVPDTLIALNGSSERIHVDITNRHFPHSTFQISPTSDMGFEFSESALSVQNDDITLEQKIIERLKICHPIPLSDLKKGLATDLGLSQKTIERKVLSLAAVGKILALKENGRYTIELPLDTTTSP